MMPGYAKKKHPVVEERMRKLQEYAEITPFNMEIPGGKKIGVITSGAAYQYAREALGDRCV